MDNLALRGWFCGHPALCGLLWAVACRGWPDGLVNRVGRRDGRVFELVCGLPGGPGRALPAVCREMPASGWDIKKRPEACGLGAVLGGVADGTRTHDDQNHNLITKIGRASCRERV